MSLTDWKQLRNQPIKLPVQAVTTGALPANTYANGTAGAGATLTANANGALPNQDGVTPFVGMRLLVNNEATGANNGIYVVTVVGDVGTKYKLTRTDDCNTNARIFAGIAVQSTADGATNGGKIWYLTTTTNPIIVGTTALTWDLQTDAEPKPTTDDKNLTPTATSGDASSTGLTITNTPYGGSYIQIFVNGQKQALGDGVKTKDSYFSNDGGITARTIATITAGDTLYWNGNVAEWNLAITDLMDFDYIV